MMILLSGGGSGDGGEFEWWLEGGDHGESVYKLSDVDHLDQPEAFSSEAVKIWEKIIYGSLQILRSGWKQ